MTPSRVRPPLAKVPIQGDVTTRGLAIGGRTSKYVVICILISMTALAGCASHIVAGKDPPSSTTVPFGSGTNGDPAPPFEACGPNRSSVME